MQLFKIKNFELFFRKIAEEIILWVNWIYVGKPRDFRILEEKYTGETEGFLDF